MFKVEKSVDLDISVVDAYNGWTLSQPLEGVDATDLVDERRMWRATFGGDSESYARIVRRPYWVVAWESDGKGLGNNGTVRFEALDATRCRVYLLVEYEPADLVGEVDDAVSRLEQRLISDLGRFKAYVTEWAKPAAAPGPQLEPTTI